MIILPGQPLALPSDLMDGLDGFYAFSEMAGKRVADASGNGRNGIVTNPVFTGSNYGNPMLLMTANSGYVALQAGAFNYTSESFSVSFAIKPSNVASTAVYAGNYTHQSKGWGILNSGSGQIMFRTNQSAANQDTTTATGILAIGKLSVVTIVRSGANAWIYVDGVDRTSSHASHVDPASSNLSTYIGTYANTPGTVGCQGNIGPVMFHRKALTQDQIKAIPSIFTGTMNKPRRILAGSATNRRRRTICTRAA